MDLTGTYLNLTPTQARKLAIELGRMVDDAIEKGDKEALKWTLIEYNMAVERATQKG